RAEPLAPAGHLGLLVEVSVEQHRAGGRGLPTARGGGDLDEDDRGAPLEAHDLDVEPGDRPTRTPVAHEGDRGVEVPVRCPVGVERGGLGGDGDVLDERGDDLVVPGALDVLDDGVGHPRSVGRWRVAEDQPQAAFTVGYGLMTLPRPPRWISKWR